MSKAARIATLAATSLAAVADTGGVILIMLTGVVALYVWLAIPLSVAMAGLLLLLAFSFRQISVAYPGGGGAYLLACTQWGERAGQVVGATLLIDALLTVAVSLIVAIDQIASLWPALFAYKAPIALVVLLLITWVNLRGLQTPSVLLATPTYLFVTTLFLLLGVGFWQALNENLRIIATVSGSSDQVLPIAGFIFVFLLLRTFSTNRTLLPGLGADNASLLAAEPSQPRRQASAFGWDVPLLLLFYLGANVLGEWVHAQPTAGEDLIAQVARAVYADQFLQFLTLASLTLLLIKVAYTCMADFSHLATLQAGAGSLPKQCLCPDKRLGFRWGSLMLTLFVGLLLLFFQGDINRLLLLYAFNVFFYLTLAQLGLGNRWRRIGQLMRTGVVTPTRATAMLGTLLAYEPFWRFKLLLTGLGTCLTAGVTVFFLIAKFTAGIWIVLLLLIGVTWFLGRMQQHYQAVTQILSQAADCIKAKE